MALVTPTLASGFAFAEGPRWRDGELWCSDIFDHRVVAVDPSGRVRSVVEIKQDEPSGLGWLPDGRLLVVGMGQQSLLRVEPGGEIAVHAELSSRALGSLNDMIVAADGTAYVGDMGVHVQRGGTVRKPGQLFMVRADGSYEVAASDLASPNGMILTPDEDMLLVAESEGHRITRFDRAADGTLAGRKEFASLAPLNPARPGGVADGICLDQEQAVWYADPIARQVVRVRRGGAVTDAIDFRPELPVACVLGGPDRTTLFVCAARTWKRDELARTRDSRIAAIPVGVPGVGKP